MSSGLKVNDADRPYDVIVCGAGHAGVEAALAAARMGGEVLLLTGNLDTVASMACNPAIGGQAKGHMVREIDALGGEMGVNADLTGIHYRLLNGSKGPAVQAPRTQCDKRVYAMRMKHVIESTERITLFQAIANKLLHRGGRIRGVETNLGNFYGKTVVITTGTFLRALTHVGERQSKGGRMGDFAAQGLSGSFLELGIELERLKTGTPPRIMGSSIDFEKVEVQGSDEERTLFGFYDTRVGGVDEESLQKLFHVELYSRTGKPLTKTALNQEYMGWMPGSRLAHCYMTHTTEATEEIITGNLRRSPMYNETISCSGPRYCPSIEDKYVRFSGKGEHRIFLEPEGLHTNEWYINGFSTSLPLEVQLEALRTIVGLEEVRVVRPAYAVEYDFAPPTQLRGSLESKLCEGLFFAGQINGTSGYEEAAGQGLVAGVNAMQVARGQEVMILGRDESYIGVLIDDLVTKGTEEPYRMFTSRAEHRLVLNHHSAEVRLYGHARGLNLVNEERLGRMREKVEGIEGWVKRLEGSGVGERVRRGEVVDIEGLDGNVEEEVMYRVKYRGYLEREARFMEKMRHLDKIKIPEAFDYESVTSLRAESLEKLKLIRPRTLGQASRISGVNPTDISLVMVSLGK